MLVDSFRGKIVLSKNMHLSEQGITAVVAFMDEKVRCSKCGKDYRKCKCIALIDDGVVMELEKGKLIGATWTNRSAFV